MNNSHGVESVCFFPPFYHSEDYAWGGAGGENYLYKLAHVTALQDGALQSPQSTEFYQLQLLQNLPRLLKI